MYSELASVCFIVGGVNVPLCGRHMLLNTAGPQGTASSDMFSHSLPQTYPNVPVLQTKQVANSSFCLSVTLAMLVR